MQDSKWKINGFAEIAKRMIEPPSFFEVADEVFKQGFVARIDNYKIYKKGKKLILKGE
jgi:hypothetical protein